jgi:hypothetical protein
MQTILPRCWRGVGQKVAEEAGIVSWRYSRALALPAMTAPG